MSSIKALLQKKAPWLWSKGYHRGVKEDFYGYLYFLAHAIPAGILYLYQDPYLITLAFGNYRTPEEIKGLKERFPLVYNRYWKMGEYPYDSAPIYDMKVRRARYPEYYPQEQ